MTMPSDVLATFIIDEGYATLPSAGAAWPIYVSAMPDGDTVQNNAIAIYNTAGLLHGKGMNGVMKQHHGIQMIFRATSESIGYAKAQEIVEMLLSKHWETVDIDSGEQYRINNISQASDIIPYLVDDKRRTHLSVNFLMSMTRVL